MIVVGVTGRENGNEVQGQDVATEWLIIGNGLINEIPSFVGGGPEFRLRYRCNGPHRALNYVTRSTILCTVDGIQYSARLS